MNKLAIRETNSISVVDAATHMVKSGYFADAKDVSQAVVKILAGQEMGFGPFASMTGVHIIQGKPTPGANLMGAAVKSSGRYDYRVREMTEAVCEIEFFECSSGVNESIGKSRFTLEDGRKAGTKNLDKFPRNMLFARAMSNGVKWYCPDVFNGAPVYTPEELGAEVDEDGNVVEGTIVPPVTAPEPKPDNSDLPANGKAWEAWYKLVEKADAMGVSVDEPDKEITTGALRVLYAELKARIDAAY